jgi:hypothetical protein
MRPLLDGFLSLNLAEAGRQRSVSNNRRIGRRVAQPLPQGRFLPNSCASEP